MSKYDPNNTQVDVKLCNWERMSNFGGLLRKTKKTYVKLNFIDNSYPVSSVSESMSSLILYCQINSNTNHTQLEKFLSKIKINSSILHENTFSCTVWTSEFRSNFLYFNLLLKYFNAQNARIVSFFTQPYMVSEYIVKVPLNVSIVN